MSESLTPSQTELCVYVLHAMAVDVDTCGRMRRQAPAVYEAKVQVTSGAVTKRKRNTHLRELAPGEELHAKRGVIFPRGGSTLQSLLRAHAWSQLSNRPHTLHGNFRHREETPSGTVYDVPMELMYSDGRLSVCIRVRMCAAVTVLFVTLCYSQWISSEHHDVMQGESLSWQSYKAAETFDNY